MATTHEDLIKGFYHAFQQRDYRTMQQLYHDESTFYDPVFQSLSSKEVKAMWQMLLTGAKDLTVTLIDVNTDRHIVAARWEAHYTFGQTQRKVHNKISATFEFKDNRIIRHIDDFSLWRWSCMALGLPGVVLGWSALIQNKVRRTAQGRLKKFINELY